MFRVFIILFLLINYSFSNEDKVSEREIIKYYIALFNKIPEEQGLEYWKKRGFSSTQLLEALFSHYPKKQSNKEFIKRVYLNLFNRKINEEELNYWLNNLEKNGNKKVKTLQAIFHSANNNKFLDLKTLNNKINIGAYIVNLQINDSDLLNLIIKNIDYNSNRLEYVKRKVIEEDIKKDFWKEYDLNQLKKNGENFFNSLNILKVYSKNKHNICFSFREINDLKIYTKCNNKTIDSFFVFFNNSFEDIYKLQINKHKINIIYKFNNKKSTIVFDNRLDSFTPYDLINKNTQYQLSKNDKQIKMIIKSLENKFSKLDSILKKENINSLFTYLKIKKTPLTAQDKINLDRYKLIIKNRLKK